MKQANNLLVYLEKLKVNEKETTVGVVNEIKVPCENYGKYLKDFKFIPYTNKQVLDYYHKKKKVTNYDKLLIDKFSRADTNNEAEALVKELYEHTDLDLFPNDPSYNLRHFF